MSAVPAEQTLISISAAGGPEVLQINRAPIPACGPGEVLIRVVAIGVNRHDVNQRRRGPDSTHGSVPGLEVSGTIVRSDSRETRWRAGDSVCALLDGGGYAEYAIARSDHILPVPPNLSLTEAAALPEALFTCWYNLFEIGQLKAGEQVLIHGGTSGVGSIAIQLLSAFGHRVFATCSSVDKRRIASSLGAADAFDYTDGAFADKVLNATQGQGVDLILDVARGIHSFENIRALRTRGRIVHLSPDTDYTKFPLRELMRKEAVLTGSLLRPLRPRDKARVAEALHVKVWPLIGERVRPLITMILPLERAAEGHALLESGMHAGKILLTPSGGGATPGQPASAPTSQWSPDHQF